jgi:hypothetical protein
MYHGAISAGQPLLAVLLAEGEDFNVASRDSQEWQSHKGSPSSLVDQIFRAQASKSAQVFVPAYDDRRRVPAICKLLNGFGIAQEFD